MAKEFLLEIGTEEIPDWMIRPALAQMRELFSKLLADHELAGEVTAVDATPRRLVLRAAGIPLKQKTKTETLTGPPLAAGERAAEGFARRHGVSADVLGKIKTEKGEYFSLRKKTPGRETLNILAEGLPGLVLKIHWPKTMYWTGRDGARFIRPIRWIVALFGSQVVPFEIAGVAAGHTTSGHRRLGAKRVRVTIANHAEQLARNYVLLSAYQRTQRIRDGITSLLNGRDLEVKADDALLETLTYLTEYPTPILGHFDESYLSLPMEVLVTVMRHHQRYFSVLKPDGTLAPHFIAVMNTSADPDGLVRDGNERVLRARFNDARFFWDFDQRRPLADRVADLGAVTFQKELGSYLDKAHRTVAIVEALGGSEHAKRAALLAKCDLTTEMVGEFPELQGAVGGLYARAQGESEEVARAVYDHYKPVSMDDAIPSTADGRLVALADKLDTLRECFRIGLIPTGSKDPFALRRAAQGVVRILAEGRLSLSVSELAEGNRELIDFLGDRIRYYFREIKGFAYDEVNAVLAANHPNLAEVQRCLEAVREVRKTGSFEPLSTAFRRIKNILKQEKPRGEPLLRDDFEQEAEKLLFDELRRVEEAARQNFPKGEYLGFLKAIADTRPAVDRFFDEVLVMDPDDRIRARRLELLWRIDLQFNAVADFSEIVEAK